MSKQMIVPHFWYDKEAVQAAEFYVEVFGGDSEVTSINTIDDTPSGQVDMVNFRILGHDFESISAGPHFKINPSISFHVKCATPEEVDAIWAKISVDGKVLMDLGEYPFSKRFGWLEDKFGVSWQIMHTEGDLHQRIIPALMFTQDLAGKAEEAMNTYASIFPDSSAQVVMRYQAGELPDKEGTVKQGLMLLNGQEFVVIDSAHAHQFKFDEAVSLIVYCKDQAEIDYYWDKLSAVPEAEQCGWVKDQFGVSWQIIPENMGELMGRNLEKTTPIMLQMKKIIIADLEAVPAV